MLLQAVCSVAARHLRAAGMSTRTMTMKQSHSTIMELQQDSSLVAFSRGTVQMKLCTLHGSTRWTHVTCALVAC